MNRSVVVITLLLAGCGSGGGGDPSAGSDPSVGGVPSVGNDPNVGGDPSGGVAVIAGVTFDWASHRHAAPGSDNWPATWSDDDHQYAVWGDGGGFGGNETVGRVSFGVARIEGSHDAYRGFNRFGGKSAQCRSNINGKGHGAPISIGGVLYAWITPGSGAAGYENFVLYKSTDKGCSWTRLDVRFARSRHGVSYGTFVQFGKDNALAPDAYVYSITTMVTDTAARRVVQRPGKIMLLRVPATAIEDRTAYEFYAGIDGSGQPIWSSDHENKVPIYEDPDGVGSFPQMTYVPGMNRCVYTNQHGDSVGTTSNKSLLTMAEAPHPWGPWTVFYRDLFFPQVEQTVFQWNFAPKWFRNDGREFTLIFSGINSNDSWNTVNGVFTVAQ